MNQFLTKAINRIQKLGKVETSTNDPLLAEIQLAQAQALIGIGEELTKITKLLEILPYRAASASNAPRSNISFYQIQKSAEDAARLAVEREVAKQVGPKKGWWQR